jgi:serine/threonine protein kinase
VFGGGARLQVYKATHKASGHGITINVAVKTLKTADASARTGLLQEAALMALLDHKNLVSMIGIVTVPRAMPVSGACSSVARVRLRSLTDSLSCCPSDVHLTGTGVVVLCCRRSW